MSIDKIIENFEAEIKKLKEENIYLKDQNEKLLNKILSPSRE